MKELAKLFDSVDAKSDFSKSKNDIENVAQEVFNMDLNSFQLQGFVLRANSEGAFTFCICHKMQENGLLQSHK